MNNNLRKLNHPDVGNSLSPVGENTFPKFELKNILEMEVPHIVVKKIDDNVEIENTHVFKALLSYFNKIYGINLSTEELLHSRSSFNAFNIFVLNCILKRYMIIKMECEDQFMYGMEKLRSKYLQNLRSIEKYYDEIIRTIFRPKGLSKKDEEVRNQMDLFEQAYSLMKIAFKNNKRDSGERYFEHLKGVMEIILRELPNPNLNKVLIALLHDVQEDIPEYADAVRVIYGDYIADGVNALSKKDWELYLTVDELDDCGIYLEGKRRLLEEVAFEIEQTKPDIGFTATKKIKEKDLKKYMNKEQKEKFEAIEENIKPFADIAKERRDDDYFGHLDDLNDDYLDVKLADRIYNLRDIDGITKEKSIHNVYIAEKYFLHVVLKRNKKIAYDLMMDAIQKNREKFNF